MSEGVQQRVVSADTLGGLEQLSRAEVRLLELARTLPAAWHTPEEWLAPLLQQVLKRRAGSEVRLEVSEPEQSEPRNYTFAQDDLFFGRDPEADVQLQVPSVSARHARIYLEGGRFLIEDLDSASGTFLNGTRLARPQPLRSGDQIEIFPYAAALQIANQWEPEPVEVVALPPRVVDPGSPHSARAFFRLEVLPFSRTAVLAVDEVLLESVFDQILGQTPGEPTGEGGGEVESGIAEYLVARVLAEMNRLVGSAASLQLRSLEATGALSGLEGELACAVGAKITTSGTSGLAHVYLDEPLLEALAAAVSADTGRGGADRVPWRLRLSMGAESLRVADLRQLGPGDILLLHGRPHLFLEDRAPLCWSGDVVSEQPWSFRVEKHERRSHLMAEDEYGREATDWEEKEPAADTSPDDGSLPPHLEGLPALLHVVVGEKEMTVADLATLGEGSVVELDQSRGDPVALLVNGRRLGEGELVEVEGKLGVRILSWG